MLNPLNAIGVTLHREPQLLLKPLKDFVSPLYSLSQKALTYDVALRMSYQWCELATRIVLFVAYSYGIRKIGERLCAKVTAWASDHLNNTTNSSSENKNENRGASFQERPLIDEFKFDLMLKIPEGICSSKTIEDFFDQEVKTGKLFGEIVSGIFGYAAGCIFSRLEYKTASLFYYENLYYLSKQFFNFPPSPLSVWTLYQTHRTIYNLKIAENAKPILARLNLLSLERCKYLDPQTIEGLTLSQILLVLPSLPTEIRNLPIDTLLQKITGPLLKTVQYAAKTRGPLTPLIERCASLSTPYMTRLFGYQRT